MRLARRRRRDGLRCIPLEIRGDEIEALVKAGLLASDARNNRTAIAAAMGKLLDRLPPERWTQLADKPELVSLDLAPEFIDQLASLGWLAPTAPRDNMTPPDRFCGVRGSRQRPEQTGAGAVSR
jgi:hypothetical protein